MVVLALAVLLLAMTGHSNAAWCVCKPGPDATLQKALDYACGAGADCNPIHQNGPCYNPNSVKDHCSYAVNSYYQRKAQTGATCDFSGTATLTTTDPSVTGCSYPASASAAGTSNTPITNVPSTTPLGNTPSTMTPTTTSPFGTTPSTGLGGGAGIGLGPTGAGINSDYPSYGGPRLLDASFFSLLLSFPAMVLLW